MTEYENSFLFVKHLAAIYQFDPEKEYENFCKTIKFRQNNPLSQFIDKLSCAMGIDPDVLRSATRKRVINYPRQVIMYVLWKEGLPFQRIGSHLGYRDHSTIISGKDNVLGWIKQRDRVILNYFKMIDSIWQLDEEHPNKMPITGEQSSI